ncbi:MAG: hypothetical protein NTY02_07005 [Acidobacteria bacterium]|nr:hypothetical protein [Acidobacteriota bacterium]
MSRISIILGVLLVAPPAALRAAEPAAVIHETFDAKFDASHFLTPIPNKNTEVRDGVQLEVDSHSKDGHHPQRQNKREADTVSGAYRLNEFLPVEKADLS